MASTETEPVEPAAGADLLDGVEAAEPVPSEVMDVLGHFGLAAGNAKEGPGPLVSSIAGKAAAFPIPVTVVPQNLSDEDLESLA